MIKKIFLAIVLTAGMCGMSHAQDVFAKGDKVINAGIGIGDFLGGNGYKTTIPPISVSYEQGIVDGLLNDKASIGVGGYLAYAANKWETTIQSNNFGYEYSHFIVGARGLFHYQFVDKLDTYAGVMLGYNVVNGKYFGDEAFQTKAAASAIAYSTFIGARYYFSKNLAAFAELGYGIAALQLGLAIKL